MSQVPMDQSTRRLTVAQALVRFLSAQYTERDGVRHRLIAGTIWLLGAMKQLPRVKASTKGEGHERRYFYGTVWAVSWAQPTLWILWKILPRTVASDAFKLVVFLGVLAFVGNLARLGRLPRTRPIVPGELAVSD